MTNVPSEGFVPFPETPKTVDARIAAHPSGAGIACSRRPRTANGSRLASRLTVTDPASTSSIRSWSRRPREPDRRNEQRRERVGESAGDHGLAVVGRGVLDPEAHYMLAGEPETPSRIPVFRTSFGVTVLAYTADQHDLVETSLAELTSEVLSVREAAIAGG
jgi:hypothetical protein